MANERILFQVGSGTVWDSLTTYNIALEEPPKAIPLESKNIATNDWYDEDGQETLIPQTIKYKAQDCTFKFICKTIRDSQHTESVFAKVQNFLNALKVNTFKYYIEYQGQGRDGCVLKKANDNADYFKNVLSAASYEEVLKFSCVFTINTPQTNVTLSV